LKWLKNNSSSFILDDFCSMELTEEQKDVLATDRNIVINAVAGSGKTTTLIEYAKTRSPDSKILYLAFNKRVKEEAIRKFAMAGARNVRVETAHSLAYDFIVKGSALRVVQGYKPYEWCDILNIKTGDRQVDLIIAGHVSKFLSYYCNSKAKRIKELDYLLTVTDPKALSFVKSFYAGIERYAFDAFRKMDIGEIGITHDYYLKKFQLNEPALDYDYILFDEGQDAGAAMLDIFLRQDCRKIIVGDMHQQIYGWRHAVNSLQQVNFSVYNLSNSFRFNDEVALVANKILGWKKHLDLSPAVKINGVGSPSEIIQSRAVLGRTNLRLLLDAIHRWQQGEMAKLHFEGNINSYTFADEGASLYDVLSLYNGKRGAIRDKFIAEMKSMKDLQEYIEKTEDTSLALIVDVVKEFGNRLPSLINDLKSHHVPKEEAEMIFGTVHRCKGMEYDEVTLLNDFIGEEKMKRAIWQDGEEKITEAKKNKLAEEINILYVAATRAKSKLIIPAEINPLRSIETRQLDASTILKGNDFKHSYADEWKTYASKYGGNYLDYGTRRKYKR
jgi:F-box protein 18 (helicase)